MPRELKIHPMLRSFSVRVFLRVALLIMSFFGLATHSSQKEVPHFRTQIVPVLTQAGCNAAACHGAATGKGGFKLSLLLSQPSQIITLSYEIDSAEDGMRPTQIVVCCFEKPHDKSTTKVAGVCLKTVQLTIS